MKKRHVVAIVIVIAIVALALYGIRKGNLLNKGKDDASSENNQVHQQLPEVDAYYGSEKIAAILGYKKAMEGQYLRDNIVPVDVNRIIPIKVSTNDRTIETIKYEVRSTGDSRLIDNGEVEKMKQKEKTASFEITVSAILEAGQEYQLILTLTTDDSEELYYYTRIMVMKENFVEGQIEFAKKFSKETLGEDTDINIATYLEPDENLKNDNLGDTSLAASYTMFQWSEMSPTLVGDVSISAKEFYLKDNGESGTYTLEYQVKASNAEGVEETYNVAETIVVWTFAGQNYVLDYHRYINQIWEATSNNIGNAFIDLGIQNQREIEVVESDNGEYIGFEINGDVYSMDLSNKEITNLFRLNAENSSALKNTKAKMIGVDDDGNANFLVYGYSTSNEHIGKNGVSVFHFNKENNESKELLFIPFSQPAETIDTQIHQLCYVNDGTIYFMLDNSLYYVNIGTKESGKVVENIPDGGYAINASKTSIAYNTDLTNINSGSITVIDLTTGKEEKIDVQNGEKLSVCGYTGDNLIYGITRAENVADTMKVSTLKIVDKEFNEITSYSPENAVITSVEITDTIINMKRAKKGKQIADDQLIDNTEKKERVVKSSYYTDSLKLKELAISFTNSLNGKNEVKANNATVIFDKKAVVNTLISPSDGEQYYVYFGGKLYGKYNNLQEARNIAKANSGLVVNATGEKVWTFEENYNE